MIVYSSDLRLREFFQRRRVCLYSFPMHQQLVFPHEGPALGEPLFSMPLFLDKALRGFRKYLVGSQSTLTDAKRMTLIEVSWQKATSKSMWEVVPVVLKTSFSRCVQAAAASLPALSLRWRDWEGSRGLGLCCCE